jgi:hypothetical protein
MRYDELPICCRNCKLLDSDYSEWSDMTFWFCVKNLWFPTKKQTCKKQIPNVKVLS